MRKNKFMESCLAKEKRKGVLYEEGKHTCEKEWEKHKREIAPQSEVSIRDVKIRSNSKLFTTILIILILLIGVCIVYFLFKNLF